MSTDRQYEAERLQLRGMEAFREARWVEAVAALSALQAMDPLDPEVGRLLGEAQLKLEISRANMPSGAPPPQTRRLPVRALAITLVALVLVGGGAFFALNGGLSRVVAVQQAAAPAVSVAAADTDPAPDSTAAPEATVAPGATAVADAAAPAATLDPAAAAPGATAAPTSAAAAAVGQGSLLVRMAEGQTIRRTTRNIEIILDASGSMLGAVNGELKIDIAHDALETLVGTLPDNTNVALRTYGHRRTDDCSDLEQLQALSPLDRGKLVQQIKAIRPVPESRTPMAASIEAVASSISSLQGETLVVLVSDGDETCDGDPAAAARALRERFPNARVSVIGFNIVEPAWRERLQAIALGGGGGYYNASDAAQLEQALQRAVALNFRVVDTTGVEQYVGPIGTVVQLPAGTYSVEISDEVPLALPKVVVGPGGQTVVQVSAEGEQMIAELLP